MTTNQEKALNRLTNYFTEYYSYGRPEEHELKEKHVEEWEELGIVYVRLTMGCIGDEGTMAEVFGRDSTAVCIGKAGGYFSYRESGKMARLSLLEATTWGWHQEQLRKKRREKKEA